MIEKIKKIKKHRILQDLEFTRYIKFIAINEQRYEDAAELRDNEKELLEYINFMNDWHIELWCNGNTDGFGPSV